MDGGDTRRGDLYFIRPGKLENKPDAEAISIIPGRKIDESHRDRAAFSFPISKTTLNRGVVRFFFLA